MFQGLRFLGSNFKVVRNLDFKVSRDLGFRILRFLNFKESSF
jgi:hypothetical protein